MKITLINLIGLTVNSIKLIINNNSKLIKLIGIGICKYFNDIIKEK